MNLAPPAPTTQTPRLVAIVGGSGSGKSWLASRLQAALPSAERLMLDDFYQETPAASGPGPANFDDPSLIDWDRLTEVLGRLEHYEAAGVPVYDFVNHRRLPEVRLARPASIILVEGLWLLHRLALRERFDFSIFIECPQALRFSRRLRRDRRARGRSADSIRRQFHETVAPMHDRFVAPQSHVADLRLQSPVSEQAVRELAVRILEGPEHFKEAA